MIDEHTAAERALHQAQRATAKESLETLHREIGDACATHQLIVDDWAGLLARTLAELEAATEPDPDPQVEAVKRAGNIRHAAELKAGCIHAEAGITRDRAIAAAERRHRQRINDA